MKSISRLRLGFLFAISSLFLLGPGQGAGVAQAAVSKPGETSVRRPNVLLLMADDLNTALSGFGHPQCKTPMLDRLAREGVRFENMHCQYPVCGASRASMMTGLYPYTNGMLATRATFGRICQTS